ncbi:helix-turn-helix transcriptional regulator [Bacillus cereus]|nr:helix-turn-helix transcriptional regulator [Bacillus cereus]MDA2572659.1 helix-turn-helix transcriptional regulator [Bacillus cereus]
MTDFGMKVRIKLLESDISMRSFAKDLGISVAYLSDILRGKRMATEQKKKIAKVLGIPYQEEREVS